MVEKKDKRDISRFVMLNPNMDGGYLSLKYWFQINKSSENVMKITAKPFRKLEYTDEVTLGRSIVNRIPYNNSLAR